MDNLQPKMRFPEFEGKWSKKTLRDITSLITKGTTPKKFVKSGVNYVKIECLKGHVIDKGKCLFIDNETHEKELKRSQLKENDLIFAIAGATIGKCSIVSSEILPANTNQALSIIRLNNNENKDYIFQILTSERMSKYILDNISVGAQPNLNLEQINSFSFFYPTLPEQTKIASFLTSVDEKLHLLKEKKAAIEEYKKGMMQKIFSQEIRFKDENGKNFSEWESKTLNQLATIFDGTHQTPNYVESGIPFYSVEHVTANQFHKTKFISNDVYEKENNRVKLEKGDILMTRIGSIGTAKLIDWDVNASFYVSLALIKQSQKISNSYLVHFIHTDFFQNELWKRTIHVAFPQKINLGEIGTCLVHYPCLEEQTKIASFLSAIDEKIELVTQQIEDTQEYKKGLLQQLFC